MLMVDAARNGHATCSVCEAIVEHTAQKRSALACENCGWAGSWNNYRGSLNGLHLIAPGFTPFCREYVQHLLLVQTPKEKMYWIDWLIHRCHWEGTALPGQPGAVCLIRGRAHDENEFLDSVSAGTHKPESVGDLGQYWSSAQKEQIIKWREAADRRKRKRKSNQSSGKPA